MGVIHTLIGKVDIQRRFSNILAVLAVLWVVQAGLFVCDTFTAIFELFQAFFETAWCLWRPEGSRTTVSFRVAGNEICF